MGIGAFLATFIAGAVATSSHAYQGVSCWTYSAQKCHTSGYHGWSAWGTNVESYSSEVCAKAITAAGNIRAGSGCNYNNSVIIVCTYSTWPATNVYGYWAGGGGMPKTVLVRAWINCPF